MSAQELTEIQQKQNQKQNQKEDSTSYSIKFDYYDETDADPTAVSDAQQAHTDIPKQKSNNDAMYDAPQNYNTTNNTGATTGEQKEMLQQQIEINTVTASAVSSNPSNPSNSAMPSMQQILGELKLNLRGQYLELDVEGETIHCKINDITPTIKSASSSNTGQRTSRLSSVQQPTTGLITKSQKRKENVELLVKDSTNRWLYVNDVDPDGEENCCDACNRCSNGCVNKFIAVTVILIQIVAYITITWFLMDGINMENIKRGETCYGPNCKDYSFTGDACMSLTTGALISVMLIGFLWADVINALGTCKYNVLASFLCLIELFTAMICGFLTAIYTPNEFDAISGAIGILFVHDLDERVFASMQIISRRKRTALIKKLLAVILWIVLSMSMSFIVACKYNSGSLIPDGSCLQSEYLCHSGATDCIWQGFVCNGIRDCDDGSDEGVTAQCNYAGFLATAVAGQDYPVDNFMCLSTGTFLKNTTRCDGKLDCEDGSDEGRASNCSEFVFRKKCGQGLTIADSDDGWHQTWSGQFKCNNGQCIDAQYACDGTSGDCVDGSDEHPSFDQSVNSPLFISRCPYSKLRHCESTEALCKIDGKCINKNKLCDGTEDCDDGQDEDGCDFVCGTDNLANKRTFQCSGAIAEINDTHIVLFQGVTSDSSNPNNATNGTISEIPYTDTSQLTYLVGLITAQDTGECIPYEWRCDGLRDCPDGSDEDLCTLFSCDAITQYQCPTSGICIAQESLCDYVYDCVDGEDEVLKNCQAFGRSFNDSSGSVCQDLGYCFGDPCEYELCPDETVRCFYSAWKCDGVCDCENCGDEGPTYGCTNTGYTPAPNFGGSSTTQIQLIINDLGIIYCGDELTSNINIGSRNSYSFQIPLTGGYANVKFTTCTQQTMGLDSYLRLYDSSNTEIASSDDDTLCMLNGHASTIDFSNNDVLFNPGNTYTIEVAGFADQNTGLYSLSVTCSI